MDLAEVGNFFREWCTKRGVKHIDAEVENTKFDEREYLESVSLSNGQTIESNFWFDCSGFARVLMSKTRNKWISYKEHLPCNTAIPFSTDVSSKTVKFETEAHAREAGWSWKIPLQHRHGNGYVFCDGFTNEDKAIQELEKKLGHKVEPIKTIKFDPGRYSEPWYNNIVAVGLSQNFLEPLQATSIHTSIISVANLIFHYLNYMENTKTHKLVIYNDNVNSYQYVMASLIRFCKHEPLQAEQCVIIANNNGKCFVKSGDFLEMFDLKNTFDNLDIKTEIQEYAKSNLY